MTPTRPISSIRVGTRHRRDLGDIAQLAASIAELGLLHPVVIAPDGSLIAGERRLEAFKQLGLCDVPVHVVDIAAIARGELAENAHRKDFTPSEMVAIAATVEEYERELAHQRNIDAMRVVAQYRQHAKRCRDLAARVSNPADKERLKHEAEAWAKMATRAHAI